MRFTGKQHFLKTGNTAYKRNQHLNLKSSQSEIHSITTFHYGHMALMEKGDSAIS
ncbi:hypothetical protein SynRS9915_02639 [Synechococcus sp. RS9915]|nr:hypothetical protein SynRS9915_02639 [Synechococcus sp. RS9915]